MDKTMAMDGIKTIFVLLLINTQICLFFFLVLTAKMFSDAKVSSKICWRFHFLLFYSFIFAIQEKNVV